MPNIHINTEKLLSIIHQISHDVALQHVLLEELIKQMPENYVDEWLKEKFHDRVETRPYYLVQHLKFKKHKAYCRTLLEIEEYIKTWHGEKESLNFDTRAIAPKVRSGKPLHGFIITQKNKRRRK